MICPRTQAELVQCKVDKAEWGMHDSKSKLKCSLVMRVLACYNGFHAITELLVSALWLLALVTYLTVGCVWRGVRLGSESLSGDGAGGV